MRLRNQKEGKIRMRIRNKEQEVRSKTTFKKWKQEIGNNRSENVK